MLFGFVFSLVFSVHAQPAIDFPEYQVEINIQEDSTVIVNETITHRFNGTSNGLRRDVTIQDPNLAAYCEENPDATCGGFDRIFSLGAYDANGNLLTEEDGFQTYNFVDEFGKEFFRFEWEVWPGGEFQNNTEVTWTVSYRLWGSIQWRDAGGIYSDAFDSTSQVGYLYWNALADTRAGNVENSSIIITFPDSVDIKEDRFTVFTNYRLNTQLNPRDNQIGIALQQNLGTFGPVTVAYEFDEDELIQPGILDYNVNGPLFYSNIFIDGENFGSATNGKIAGIPEGEYDLRFESFGFEKEELSVDVLPGEISEVDVSLDRTPLMQAFFILNIIMMIVGVAIAPLGIFWVFVLYRNRGRDKNMPKTIIPEFKPPEGVHPYLLGSLKDEKVDKEDIVGSIIDLAYRGFIKIKELPSRKGTLSIAGSGKSKDFELKRIADADTSKLSSVEQEILDAIFNNKDTIKTKEMRNHFPQKYRQIVNNTYKEMVEKKYFTSSPRTTRAAYAGIGLSLLIISTLAGCCLTVGLSFVLNFPIVFTPMIGLFVAGFLLLFVANFMPAKTTLGSKTFANILGFKMYLETAERFRLQNLGPEEFERYLSYAIVFKIEKQWAEKFEGIYEGSPDWYEGSAGTVYDAILISSLTRSFANSTITAATPVQSSSGGGWSGGGSFGGFSGGGGGGGSVGGW